MTLTLTEFSNRFHNSQYRDNFTPWALAVIYQYLQENDLEYIMDDVTAICGDYSEGELSTLAGGLRPTVEDFTSCDYDEDYDDIPGTEEFDGEGYRQALLKDLGNRTNILGYKDETHDMTVVYSDY